MNSNRIFILEEQIPNQAEYQKYERYLDIINFQYFINAIQHPDVEHAWRRYLTSQYMKKYLYPLAESRLKLIDHMKSFADSESENNQELSARTDLVSKKDTLDPKELTELVQDDRLLTQFEDKIYMSEYNTEVKYIHCCEFLPRLPLQTPTTTEFQPIRFQSPLIAYLNYCLKKQLEAKPANPVAIANLNDNIYDLSKHAYQVATIKQPNKKKILQLEVDGVFLKFNSQGIFFSKDSDILLKNIREPEAMKKLILDWIAHDGVIAFATRGYGWKYYTVDTDEEITMPYCSGEELVELHLKALLGSTYDRVKNNILIKAFMVIDRKTAFDAIKIVIKPENKDEFMLKIELIAREAQKAFKQPGADPDNVNNLALDMLELLNAKENQLIDMQEDTPPQKVSHAYEIIKAFERTNDNTDIDLTIVDNCPEELFITECMLKPHVRSIKTIYTNEKTRWISHLQDLVTPPFEVEVLFRPNKIPNFSFTKVDQIENILSTIDQKQPIQIIKRAENPIDANMWLREGYDVNLTAANVSTCDTKQLEMLCNVSPKGVAELLPHSIRFQELINFSFLIFIAKYVTEKSLLVAVSALPFCESLTTEQIEKLSSMNLLLGLEILKAHKPHLIHSMLGTLPSKLAAITFKDIQYFAETGNVNNVPDQKRQQVLQRSANSLKKFFMTVEEYIDHMLYSPVGFYRKFIQFDKDFSTFSSRDSYVKVFGAAFAFQLFAKWQEQIRAGNLSNQDKFNVLEGGAGLGKLCFHILNTIKQMTQSDSPQQSEWIKFCQAISYHIVEVSPELANKQRKTNVEFREKLTVINSDARDLKKALADKKITAQMSVVFANELLDAFPQHEVIYGAENSFAILMVSPSISSENLKLLGISAARIDAMEKKSNSLKSDYPGFVEKNHFYNIILSKEDFREIHEIAVNKNLNNLIKFGKFPLQSQFFPEITKYIKQNSYLFASAKFGDQYLVNLGTEKYLDNVYTILKPGGEIILVDYGQSGRDANPYLRTFANMVYGNDILASNPGTFDITGDVYFTHVANYARQIGLLMGHYGPQWHLVPVGQNALPESVLSPQQIHHFIRGDYQEGFKVIVLKKPDSLNLNLSIDLESKSSTHGIVSKLSRFAGTSRPVMPEEILEQEIHLYRSIAVEIGMTVFLLQMPALRSHTNLILDYVRDSVKEHIEQVLDEASAQALVNSRVIHLINHSKLLMKPLQNDSDEPEKGYNLTP